MFLNAKKLRNLAIWLLTHKRIHGIIPYVLKINCLGVAQFGSVLEWGSRGRRFKSFHPDQNRNGTSFEVPFLFLFEERFYPSVTAVPCRGSRGECRRKAGKMIRWIVFQARTGARVPQAARSGRAHWAAKGSNPFTQTNKKNGHRLMSILFV